MSRSKKDSPRNRAFGKRAIAPRARTRKRIPNCFLWYAPLTGAKSDRNSGRSSEAHVLQIRQKTRARTFWVRALQISRQRPTLPHSFPCSTIGSEGLNGRVRNGNGWSPLEIG